MQLRDKSDKGPFVDISVNTDTLVLRGTGVDVEPALLSGNVVLYLSEPTAIKEIQLQFRGKARIPPSANESYVHFVRLHLFLRIVLCHISQLVSYIRGM